MSFKIALAGDLGGGKSTVAKILREKTGAEIYSTGAICRAIAARHGMQIADFNQYMETHPEVDREIDDGLIALSDREENLLIDSRMAFHFVRGSFSVYMTTDPLVTADRVLRAKRKGEAMSDLETAAKELKRRRVSESKRYSEQYGVDIQDLTLYSLVIDTSFVTPERIAHEILAALEAWQADKSRKVALLSPKRIYTKASLPCPNAPTPKVTEKDGSFYLLSGESTLALKKGDPLVACELLSATISENDYHPIIL